MSITVYVDGWNEQPRVHENVFLTDTYPDLDEDYFAGRGVQRDEHGRYFETQLRYVDPFPEMNMSNMNWVDLCNAICIAKGIGGGALSVEEVPLAIRRCMRFMNSETYVTQAIRVGGRHDNIIDFGTSEDYLRRKTKRFIEILKFAQSKDKSVYWG